jgi:hypothetical protein
MNISMHSLSARRDRYNQFIPATNIKRRLLFSMAYLDIKHSHLLEIKSMKTHILILSALALSIQAGLGFAETEATPPATPPAAVTEPAAPAMPATAPVTPAAPEAMVKKAHEIAKGATPKAAMKHAAEPSKAAAPKETVEAAPAPAAEPAKK